MSREDAALWERLSRFWADVARQDSAALREWFAPEAEVYWHCTDERCTAEEYIRAKGQERPFSCGVFFPFRGGQDHPLR